MLTVYGISPYKPADARYCCFSFDRRETRVGFGTVRKHGVQEVGLDTFSTNEKKRGCKVWIRLGMGIGTVWHRPFTMESSPAASYYY